MIRLDASSACTRVIVVRLFAVIRTIRGQFSCADWLRTARTPFPWVAGAIGVPRSFLRMHLAAWNVVTALRGASLRRQCHYSPQNQTPRKMATFSNVR